MKNEKLKNEYVLQPDKTQKDEARFVKTRVMRVAKSGVNCKALLDKEA